MTIYGSYEALIYINQRVGREVARYLKRGRNGFIHNLLKAGDLVRPITQDQLDMIIEKLKGAINIRDIVEGYENKKIAYRIIRRSPKLDPYFLDIDKRRWIKIDRLKEFKEKLKELYDKRKEEIRVKRENERKLGYIKEFEEALLVELKKSDQLRQMELLDIELEKWRKLFEDIGKPEIYRDIVGNSEPDNREDEK